MRRVFLIGCFAALLAVPAVASAEGTQLPVAGLCPAGANSTLPVAGLCLFTGGAAPAQPAPADQAAPPAPTSKVNPVKAKVLLASASRIRR